MRFVSNSFFWAANISLITAVILLEVATRHMRKGENLKRKKLDKVAVKFLIASGVLYLLSLLFAFI